MNTFSIPSTPAHEARDRRTWRWSIPLQQPFTHARLADTSRRRPQQARSAEAKLSAIGSNLEARETDFAIYQQDCDVEAFEVRAQEVALLPQFRGREEEVAKGMPDPSSRLAQWLDLQQSILNRTRDWHEALALYIAALNDLYHFWESVWDMYDTRTKPAPNTALQECLKDVDRVVSS